MLRKSVESCRPSRARIHFFFYPALHQPITPIPSRWVGYALGYLLNAPLALTHEGPNQVVRPELRVRHEPGPNACRLGSHVASLALRVLAWIQPVRNSSLLFSGGYSVW